MQFISRRLPSPAMLVAVLALVVALSGTAVAASSLVNGDSIIRKGSLSGDRLRNHTLTGKQIKLSKLGTVPQASFATNAAHAASATSATNATNATKATSATNATHATSADSATLAQTLPALVWHPLTLINGWVDYNGSSDARTPAYAVDAQGIVHFRGAIKNPSNSTGPFAVLPASVTPSQDVWVATDLYGAAPGRIDVFTNGDAYADWTTLISGETGATAADFTSLDGVSYPLG